MNVIISGANGFIGSALMKALEPTQYKVVTLNRVNERGLFKNLSLARIEDVKAISSKIREFQPDIIFHLAANTSISKSWVYPFKFISENIAISENLLDAIHLSVLNPRVLLFSSSAVYDESETPIPENFRLAPNSPYAISKLTIESLALRYQNSIILRPFFTVGAGRRGDIVDEWYSKIVRFKTSNSEGVFEVGDLSLVRDYLEVRDCANLIIDIAEKGCVGEIYNLCSGVGTTLQNLCQVLIEEMGCTSLVEISSKVDQNASPRRKVVGDTSKLKVLGIEPHFNLRNSIRSWVQQRLNSN